MIWTILLLGTILRLFSAGNQSLWLDEATSALVVKNFSFTEIINRFIVHDFHPPLYYLALKLWSGIFGYGELALRSLSIVFGIASIFVVYSLTKKLFNKQTALLASLFLSLNGLHVYYSQEARMYMMSLFIVVFLILEFVNICKDKAGKVHWFLFSLLLVVNFLTDYLPSLIIIPLWIYAFLYKKNDNEWWKKFVLSHIPLLIFALLWLPILKQQLNSGFSVQKNSSLWFNILGRTSAKELFLVPVKFVFGRITIVNKLWYVMVFGGGIFVLLLIEIGQLIKYKFGNTKLNLLYLWFFVPLFLGAVIGLRIPVFTYFRLIFLLPPVWILTSFSLGKVKNTYIKKMLSAIIVFLLASSSLFYLFHKPFHRENWRQAVDFVTKNSESANAVVIFSSNSQKEAYLYYNNGMDNTLSVSGIEENTKSVFLFRYVADIFDPKNIVPKQLSDIGFVKTEEFDYNGIPVWQYQR